MHARNGIDRTIKGSSGPWRLIISYSRSDQVDGINQNCVIRTRLYIAINLFSRRLKLLL